MIKRKVKFFTLLAALSFASAAYGQNSGTVTAGAYAIGKGPNQQGFASLLCGSAQLAVGQISAAPICRNMNGDATFSAAGALTLGTVNANVGTFGSSTQCVTFTVNAKGLVTAASQTACAAGGGSTPGGTSGQIQWNSAGSFAGFTASGDLTVNTSTGVFTFGTVNANVGTFGSATQCATLTVNAKGLVTAASQNLCTPAIANVTGLGTGVGAALAINIGSAGAPVTFNGAGGTPSSMVGTNITGTAAGLTAGTATNAVNSGVTNDTTTNATMFPVWVTANTGNQPAKVSSTKLSFNPSTGLLSSTGFAGSGASLTAVPLAGLASQAANTLVANVTAGGASPTAVDISALTTKAGPTASDWILISDQAAAGALKKAAFPAAGTGTVTSTTVTAGTGISISGTCTSTSILNCTVNQSLTNTVLMGTVGTPTSTSSGTQVMLGLGVTTCRITPAYSTRLHVEITGYMSNTGANINVAQIRFGTGAGPANGAAATGTALGQVQQGTSAIAGAQTPFALPAIITGLTPGTTYWLDLGFFTNGGTTTFNNPTCIAFEF